MTARDGIMTDAFEDEKDRSESGGKRRKYYGKYSGM
jgi:hypothetical protein